MMTRLTGREVTCMTRQKDYLLPLVLPPTTESQIEAWKRLTLGSTPQAQP